MHRPPLTRPGFFGKLPACADFISRGLGPEFVGGWDACCMAGLAGLRARRGRGWEAGFMAAAPWRFIAQVGRSTYAGVTLASQDSVGRHYPLLLAAALPREVDGQRLLLQEAGWFARLEDLALRARAGSDGPALLAQGCRSLPQPRLALQADTLADAATLWWRRGAGAPSLACSGWPGALEFAALFGG